MEEVLNPMRTSFTSVLSVARFTALAFATILLASPAYSLTVISSNSGLDQGLGCGDSGCLFSQIFTLDASAPVTGTFDLTGSTLTFSIDMGLASFSGSDGAVTGVDFSNVNYSGSVTVAPGAPGFVNIIDQPSTITGTLTPVGAGSATLFNLSGVNTVGDCLTAGGTITCGLIFGAGTGFPIDVNGATRYFNHKVDFVALIPEPGTALLLGSGLAMLGAQRRRRR